MRDFLFFQVQNYMWYYFAKLQCNSCTKWFCMLLRKMSKIILYFGGNSKPYCISINFFQKSSQNYFQFLSFLFKITDNSKPVHSIKRRASLCLWAHDLPLLLSMNRDRSALHEMRTAKSLDRESFISTINGLRWLDLTLVSLWCHFRPPFV